MVDLSIAHYLDAAPRAPSTRKIYQYALADFEKWLAVRGRPTHLATTSDVTTYIDLFRKAGKSSASVAQRFYNLRGYFLWLVDIGAIERSPMTLLRVQAATWGYPETVSVDDLRLLLASAQNERAWTLIAILAFSSLRVSELLECDVSSLETRSGYTYLRFAASTGKHRLPLTVLDGVVSDALRRTLGGRRSGPLFVNPQNTRIHRSTASGIIQQAGVRAGLSYKVTPQMLVYSLPVAALENGFSFVSLIKSTGVPQPRHSDRWLNSEQPLTLDNASLRLTRMVLEPADSTNNWLSQGESLLSGTTRPEALSVMAAGSALERHLRQLAIANGVPAPTDQDLGTMNRWAGQLHTLKVIRTADKHLIDSIGNLRNWAAHGFYERCTDGAGERTFRSVRELVERYPLPAESGE